MKNVINVIYLTVINYIIYHTNVILYDNIHTVMTICTIRLFCWYMQQTITDKLKNRGSRRRPILLAIIYDMINHV